MGTDTDPRTWDDAELGQAVRAIASRLGEEAFSDGPLMAVAAARLLVALALEREEDAVTLQLEDVRHGDGPAGDWTVSVERAR